MSALKTTKLCQMCQIRELQPVPGTGDKFFFCTHCDRACEDPKCGQAYCKKSKGV